MVYVILVFVLLLLTDNDIPNDAFGIIVFDQRNIDFLKRGINSLGLNMRETYGIF